MVSRFHESCSSMGRKHEHEIQLSLLAWDGRSDPVSPLALGKECWLSFAHVSPSLD